MLPSFDDFIKSQGEGFSEKVLRYSVNGLITNFNKEELQAIMEISFRISYAMLREYHEWLCKQIGD